MLSDQDIFNRYQQKIAEFEKQAEVSLIGHSLFDMWENQPNGTPALANKSVANLGISGVSTRQYLDVIVKDDCIRQIGEKVFIFLGVNDIAKEKDYSPQQVVAWLQAILGKLRQTAPHSSYYLLEATPVNHITTVTNQQIRELNAYLQSHCPEGLQFIPTQAEFSDSEGNLQNELSVDGLHFSAKGYAVLQQILLRYLAS